VRQQAADDLDNWKTQRSIKMSAKKDANRTEEQVLLEQLESEIDVGNTWDRVSKLIDSGADFSTESNKADVTRMRKLFIQLKNDPLEVSRVAAIS
jgi:Clathrin light chain